MMNQSRIWPVIVLLLIIGFLYAFIAYVPAQKSSMATSTPAAVTYYCADHKTISANFATSSVALTLSDGRTFTLPQTVSGSGIRYEATTTSADIVFQSKGDNGFLTEGTTTTFMQCTAARVADSDAPGYETYTNLSKTFTFAFPTNFEVVGTDPGYGPGWSAPASTTGMVLAKIVVPQSFEPGTNFGNAWFTVGTSADPEAVATCLKNLSGTAPTTTPVTIGDRTYTKLEFEGVGAGQIYDTTSYRTVKDNQCYAIEYTIHSARLENYPKGAVTAFDEAKVTSALDEVAQSFRFLQ